MEVIEMDTKSHWERVYQNKASDEVSWFQAEPTTSLAFLDQVGLASTT